ncbi:hypothetical protein [Kutzneria buriramensis]|uniref:Uncharacterized protein n=1 Tax=Kutzneria buriramensis TaxID=1045776 RepID=A0A3E0I957_9PSEU|nr:hypothetical protein [Kutzneria buriramensis]REH55187.1 hypothetical protein BCF44_101204 [Kutzneria buriramensis]
MAENEKFGVSAEISRPSTLADAFRLRMYPLEPSRSSWGPSGQLATLKVQKPSGLKDRAEAYDLLLTVSKFFSFELDVRYGHGFDLCERPGWPPHEDEPAQSPKEKFEPLNQPLALTFNNYSKGGLSYYWHGRRAESVPTMEYLSYYQVLEYHFAQYALAATVEFTRQRLKDPRFDATGSESLASFVNAISKQVKSNSAELTMLQVTLSSSVDPSMLVEFIESDENLMRHLRNKNALPGVPVVPTNQPDKLDSIVEKFADRIYKVRCQLVHAKGENRQEGAYIMIPGSAEMRHLEQEIKLVRFAAQSVLIHSSTTGSP